MALRPPTRNARAPKELGRIVHVTRQVPNPWRSPLLEGRVCAFDERKFLAQHFCRDLDGVSLANPRKRSLGGYGRAGIQHRLVHTRSGLHQETTDQ